MLQKRKLWWEPGFVKTVVHDLERLLGLLERNGESRPAQRDVIAPHAFANAGGREISIPRVVIEHGADLERWRNLDRGHAAAAVRQQRSEIARAGADLQGLVMRFDLQLLQYARFEFG